MRRRHPLPERLPRRWLMTDPRLGDQLWNALAAMPRGSGVVFRHYELPRAERLALFARVQQVARRRGLVVVVGGQATLGHCAAGSHGRHVGALTAPVHSRREAVAAIKMGATLLFVSPVFATRSHPEALSLGRVRLGFMLHGLNVPAVALGGMNERRWRGLRSLGIHGWAGIDGWGHRARLSDEP